ncbi:MAG TPA: universal stress protein [Thermoanaerobaculia bacterium]|nr:universal stress protein [Thermoanaerobaculia bacterium]
MKILVATDGARTSGAAVRFAAALAAKLRGGNLTVITVGRLPSRRWLARPRSGQLESPIEERERVWSQRVLERARRDAERLGARVRTAYAGANKLEPIAQTIARTGSRERADLVVVGSGGAKEFLRYTLGSITHRLVHVSRLPVAVVRAGAATGRGPVRILAATDGSKPSRAAVALAARLASAIPRSRLVVLSVSTLAADIALTGAAFVRALGVLPDLDRAERTAADRILRGAAKLTRGLGKRAEFVYRKPGRPTPAARTIVREAALRASTLIVLGNAGRSAVNDLVLGSVAQRVLDLSRRPVVLVRADSKGGR